MSQITPLICGQVSTSCLSWKEARATEASAGWILRGSVSGLGSSHGAVMDERCTDEHWAGFSEGKAAVVAVADISAQRVVILQREKQGEDVSPDCS